VKAAMGRLFRRRQRGGDGASRWSSASVMGNDSHNADASQLPSQFSSTSFALDSLWSSPGTGDEQRWLRQFHASRRWAIWGVLLGAFFGLLLFAPAQWLTGAVHKVTEGRLVLAEAQGTVWDGSAVPVLTGGAGSRDAIAPPGRLHWQLRPHWTGLRLDLRQPCCVNDLLRLRVQPGWGQVTLRLEPPAAAGQAGAPAGAQELGRWPTAWLGGLGAPWNTLELRGLMHVASPGLTLHAGAGRLRLEGGLSIELRNLSSRLSPLPVLGSYRLDVQGLPGGAEGSRLQLHTLDGALQLSGDGQFSGQRLRFRGQASATPGQETALSNLLNIIGRRQGALSVISIG